MPRVAVQRRAAERLEQARGQGRARFVDMRLEIRVLDTEEIVLSVGGRWDRKRKRYVGPGSASVVWHVHAGQVEAAQWFARWLWGYVRGQRGPDDELVWSVLFGGGRRGGKTRLACYCVIAFVVAVYGAIAWCISPTIPETEELQDYLDEFLPREWYRWREEPQAYYLANGSRINMRSAYKPRALKRGKADLVFLNEAQNQERKVFEVVRPATADSGGLVIMAANPPDKAIGEWVEEYRTAARAGAIEGKAFDFDPTKNPFPEPRSLAALKKEVDEITYRREILGEWLPVGDRVWHQFSDHPTIGNVLETGTDPRDRELPLDQRRQLRDVTQGFTRRVLGREFQFYAGADFQLTPHMVMLIDRAFEDPEDPKDVLLWTVAAIIVPDATEDELIDAAERAGFTGGDVTGVVGDGSGEWQNAERTKGRGSFDVFRRRGWRIYPPDPGGSTKNPDVSDTIKVGNARWRSADGRIHDYVDPSVLEAIRAFKKWEFRNGAPNKRSDFAHLSDVRRYQRWRAFPRKPAPQKVEVLRIERAKSSRRQSLDVV